MKVNNTFKALYVILFSALIAAGCSGTSEAVKTNGNGAQANLYQGINLDTVKAQRFDTGKMWTFDIPPTDYFQEEYGFRPTQEWYDKARLSALRFATYCSASFISEDGLVMTNHHCGRESVQEVQKEGEDLYNNGFYAYTLEEERKVPGLFVDQLVKIQDVTKEIQTVIDQAKTEAEKVQAKTAKIAELEAKYSEETGLVCKVTTLYHGGKYSLYGYKRYTDVRLVFSPETPLGYFGGDYDNFTYPRYNLDFNFFRVYGEDGKPLKTPNYYKWSKNGAKEGEPIFVVGNPGRTNRLNTVAQLEYYRDYAYPMIFQALDDMVNVYTAALAKHPERKEEILNDLFSVGNSQKVYKGILAGLNDPILMARKKDFEKNFKKAVMDKPELKEKYGNIWNEIEFAESELSKIAKESNAYMISPFLSSKYFVTAKKLLTAADQMKLPSDQRKPDYQDGELDSTLAAIYPEDMDQEIETMKLAKQIDQIKGKLGADHEIVKKLFGSKPAGQLAEEMVKNSQIAMKEGMLALAKQGPDAIANSNDPFITYVAYANEHVKPLAVKSTELRAKEETNQQALGRALFEVYGPAIPPDATFTLRIADGVVKGYEYNGTIAPVKTTFYGLYDRYYGFDGKFPYELPEKWLNPPAELNLETPMNFISTNDIIGGNSGSPVINKNLEIVGVAFDGNIESLPGQFIYTTEANRTVSVASEGMLEVVRDFYKVDRLGKELETGKMPEAAAQAAEPATSSK